MNYFETVISGMMRRLSGIFAVYSLFHQQAYVPVRNSNYHQSAYTKKLRMQKQATRYTGKQ